jgi:hypothetical protein
MRVLNWAFVFEYGLSRAVKDDKSSEFYDLAL